MSQSSERSPFRRRFPRKALRKRIGVLFDGQYFICDSGDIGEGGMSLLSEFAFSEDRELVLTFQIPGGSFVSLRGLIRSVIAKDGVVNHGVSFAEIPVAYKREIRAFVSARTSANKSSQSLN